MCEEVGLPCREIGGQMSPMWARYYNQCGSICFVVDTSQRATIAEAALEFYELLNHEAIKVRTGPRIHLLEEAPHAS